MSSLQKKVILRRFPGGILHGYLPSSGFIQGDQICYLDLEGRLATVPLAEIKTVCYVRDFNLTDRTNPERLLRRNFVARPRGEGLWIRITFREQTDTLEGLTLGDVSLLDGILIDRGLHLSPPDSRSNTQRIYVPRLAMTNLQIVAVIQSASKRSIAMPSKEILTNDNQISRAQETLFEGAPAFRLRRGKQES